MLFHLFSLATLDTTSTSHPKPQSPKRRPIKKAAENSDGTNKAPPPPAIEDSAKAVAAVKDSAKALEDSAKAVAAVEQRKPLDTGLAVAATRPPPTVAKLARPPPGVIVEPPKPGPSTGPKHQQISPRKPAAKPIETAVAAGGLSRPKSKFCRRLQKGGGFA